MRNRILVVNEKQGNQKELAVILAGLGDINCSQTIQDALLNMITHRYQLIVIVGINNPEYLCKVIEIIRIINKIPILVLGADYAEDRIKCIKAGADVVLNNSSSDLEIKYQAIAMIRGYDNRGDKIHRNERILQFGFLKMDYSEQRCFWKKDEIRLTKHEFDFLYVLASTPKRVYTFEQIYKIVWKDESHGDINNILWCFVHRLRKKLKAQDPRAEKIIKCARNVGYYFEPIEDIP